MNSLTWKEHFNYESHMNKKTSKCWRKIPLDTEIHIQMNGSMKWNNSKLEKSMLKRIQQHHLGKTEDPVHNGKRSARMN